MTNEADIYIAVGVICTGLGILGIFLPGLPTTPLLLAAAFCFARGSERLHAWLVSRKFYKKHIERIYREKSISAKSKVYILSIATVMLGVVFVLADNVYVRILLALAVILKYYLFLFRIKTRESEASGNSLLSLAHGTVRYIVASAVVSAAGLAANIFFILSVSFTFKEVLNKSVTQTQIYLFGAVAVFCAAMRFGCAFVSKKLSGKISANAKKELREKVYRKLVSAGASYNAEASSAEILQTSVEGIEQLDSYYSRYLPQMIYSLISTAAVGGVLAFIYLPAAIVLFLGALIIPVSLLAVRAAAGKLFKKYWRSYTNLGRVFLDNLNGLTLLKIFRADEYKNVQMNDEAERFRQSTMRVLRMQLMSISVMDMIAYGGVAAGVLMAAAGIQSGSIEFYNGICIVLFAAELFLPLRQLGSLFHVAMSGVSAGKRIFALLDMPDYPEGKETVCGGEIIMRDVSFAYGEKEILSEICAEMKAGGITAVVGESGSGKSTLAGLLAGMLHGYSGSICINGTQLRDIASESLFRNVTYVAQGGYIFSGTIEDNLRLGNPEADEALMHDALEKVNLLDLAKQKGGMKFVLEEGGGNLSGGQRQRLVLARALLHDSPVYIFDEVTSNVDYESEKIIMDNIYALGGEKTVLLISHRLENVRQCDMIYVLENNTFVQCGTHDELMKENGLYHRLYAAQEDLQVFSGRGSELGKTVCG